MSQAYQERFLREQIAAYDQLLCDSAAAETSRAHRNIIKTIEKQKARREERLKDLLAEEKKDDGLVFDELGVDHVFIDEAHTYQEPGDADQDGAGGRHPDRGQRTGLRPVHENPYLHQQHPGHGVTFATGTPISNTMVEMYTMQRFLDPEGLAGARPRPFRRLGRHLRRSGRRHGISPRTARACGPAAASPGSPTCRNCSRCSAAIADVQTAAMLDLPRPRLAGGKADRHRLPDVRGAVRHPGEPRRTL